MTLRNDGNVIMTGCTVEFPRSRDGRAWSSAKSVDAFAKENVVESAWTAGAVRERGRDGLRGRCGRAALPGRRHCRHRAWRARTSWPTRCPKAPCCPGARPRIRSASPSRPTGAATKKTYIVLKDYQFIVPGTPACGGRERRRAAVLAPRTTNAPRATSTCTRKSRRTTPDLGDSVVTREGGPVRGDGCPGRRPWLRLWHGRGPGRESCAETPARRRLLRSAPSRAWRKPATRRA